MSPYLDNETRRDHRLRNLTQSLLLGCGMALVLGLAAGMLWGLAGIIVAFLTIGFVATYAPRLPARLVMRVYRAKPAPDGQITQILQELSARAELPQVPALYVVPSMTLNAFATGTSQDPAIAVTEGLLRNLTMREITGVLAHEVGHIRNGDLWLMNLADIITRLVQPMSYVAIALAALNAFAILRDDVTYSWTAIALLYLSPAICSLLQLALSRTREFDADLEAASITGDAMGLASALRRLDNTTGSMFEDLTLPVPGRQVPQPSMLRTHPATEERIERLLALAPQPLQPPIIVIDEPMVSLVGFGPIEMRPRYRWPGLWY